MEHLLVSRGRLQRVVQTSVRMLSDWIQKQRDTFPEFAADDKVFEMPGAKHSLRSSTEREETHRMMLEVPTLLLVTIS
jgi:hypothetical protein